MLHIVYTIRVLSILMRFIEKLYYKTLDYRNIFNESGFVQNM